MCGAVTRRLCGGHGAEARRHAVLLRRVLGTSWALAGHSLGTNEALTGQFLDSWMAMSKVRARLRQLARWIRGSNPAAFKPRIEPILGL